MLQISHCYFGARFSWLTWIHCNRACINIGAVERCIPMRTRRHFRIAVPFGPALSRGRSEVRAMRMLWSNTIYYIAVGQGKYETSS